MANQLIATTLLTCNDRNFGVCIMCRGLLVVLFILFLSSHSSMADKPIDYQFAPGKNAVDKRKHWAQMSSGENLALGRPVTFSMKPDDPLTSDENDPYDLTDGKITAREDDRIWFERDAVGWSYRGGNVNLRIDLGEVQPVGRLVVRFLGGAEQRGLHYPREISIVGSDDGESYYTIASRLKLLPAEKELAAESPERYYFLAESGTASTDAFIFNIHRRTRCVGLMVKGDGNFVYTDQIAVIKDEQPDECRALTDGLEPVQFIIGGVAIQPRQKEMVITTNIQTPNYFSISDARSDRSKAARFYFDLPDALTLVTPTGTATAEPSGKPGITRWVLDDFYDVNGDFNTLQAYNSTYISLKPGKSISEGATATLSSDDPDSQGNMIEVPIRTVEIPIVRPLKRLDVTMAWMVEFVSWAMNPDIVQFPDVLPAFKQMGFNTIPTFPRYFTEDYYAEFQKPILRKTIDDARVLEFRIVYNESSFHLLAKRHADKPEIYNQIDGKQGQHICPSYTGTYYQEEMRNVARLAQVVRPDQVFHDDEMWYYPGLEAVDCSRCKEGFAESGLKDFDQYLQAQGTRMMRDLYEAVAGSAPDGGNPVVGLYNVHISSPIYEHVYNFNLIYPKYVQLSQPSLYVQNRVQIVHDVIQDNYRRLNSNNIVPWITPGTYGEYPPEFLEKIILECFLNGARGVAYFMFMDFDPMDFYYHAYTIKLIAPYEDLLADGKPVRVCGDNEGLTYSAYGNGAEALVLIGNYSRAPDGKVSLSFPDKQPVHVYDVKAKKELKPSDLEKLNIAPDEHRLFHVTFKNM